MPIILSGKKYKTTMIQIAQTKSQKQAAYRLRYRIYIEELNRKFLHNCQKTKSISDRYDNHATVMISHGKNEMNGTLRVNISSWDVHLENRFGIFPSDSTFVYAYVDNFVLLPEYRKTKLALQYIIRVFEYGVDRKVDLCLIESAPELLEMYQKLGFTPYRTVEKDGNIRYQMALKPFDLYHLKESKSLFFSIMKRRQKKLERTYANEKGEMARLRQVV